MSSLSSFPRSVRKLINFNGELVLTAGKVIGSRLVGLKEYFVVDFSHDGIEFRGLWDVREVEVVAKQ